MRILADYGIGIEVGTEYDEGMNDVPVLSGFYALVLVDLQEIERNRTGKLLLEMIAAQVKLGREITIGEQRNAGNKIARINRAAICVRPPQPTSTTSSSSSSSSSTVASIGTSSTAPLSSNISDSKAEASGASIVLSEERLKMLSAVTQKARETAALEPIYSEGHCYADAEDVTIGMGLYSDRSTKVRVDYDPTIRRYKDGSPSWIVLAHELIHAVHRFHGTRKPKDKMMAYQNKMVEVEELETVGLGQFSFKSITENAIRADASLPLRLQY